MRTALDRLKCIEIMDKKLSKYKYLQDSLSGCDVDTDEKYRTTFKSFYGVRRDDEWCDTFFSILQKEKLKTEPAISFYSVLKKVFDKTRRVETSYCSKLIAGRVRLTV